MFGLPLKKHRAAVAKVDALKSRLSLNERDHMLNLAMIALAEHAPDTFKEVLERTESAQSINEQFTVAARIDIDRTLAEWVHGGLRENAGKVAA